MSRTPGSTQIRCVGENLPQNTSKKNGCLNVFIHFIYFRNVENILDYAQGGDVVGSFLVCLSALRIILCKIEDMLLRAMFKTRISEK